MAKKTQLSVAYVGSYDSLYTRVRTVLKGLRKQGVYVIECNSKNPYKLVRLAIIGVKYLMIAHRVDVLIVSEAGHAYVPLAKILSFITRKPFIFDAFLSYYHINVFDTKSVSTHSLAGRYYYYMDKIGCLLADIVLLDTPQHINYFCETFNLSPDKFRCVPVGSDDEWFYPMSNGYINRKNFVVFLVASFYPLHGVEYVIQAAKLLENEKDIKFHIIGNGYTRPLTEVLIQQLNVTNVILKDPIPSYILPDLISQADICLGQFGNTQHAQLVVPAKVYDSLAMKKATITGAGQAVMGIFNNKQHIVYCPFANPQAIADAILLLKNNEQLREQIAENGYRLFRENFSLSHIGEKLVCIINDLLLEK